MKKEEFIAKEIQSQMRAMFPRCQYTIKESSKDGYSLSLEQSMALCRKYEKQDKSKNNWFYKVFISPLDTHNFLETAAPYRELNQIMTFYGMNSINLDDITKMYIKFMDGECAYCNDERVIEEYRLRIAKIYEKLQKEVHNDFKLDVDEK